MNSYLLVLKTTSNKLFTKKLNEPQTKKPSPQTYLLLTMNTVKIVMTSKVLHIMSCSWMWGLLDSLYNLTYIFTVN